MPPSKVDALKKKGAYGFFEKPMSIQQLSKVFYDSGYR
jgi:FixJ family two-component response regulator